jgi:hypothetical protein
MRRESTAANALAVLKDSYENIINLIMPFIPFAFILSFISYHPSSNAI